MQLRTIRIWLRIQDRFSPVNRRHNLRSVGLGDFVGTKPPMHSEMMAPPYSGILSSIDYDKSSPIDSGIFSPVLLELRAPSLAVFRSPLWLFAGEGLMPAGRVCMRHVRLGHKGVSKHQIAWGTYFFGYTLGRICMKIK
jgi:hypothetical protein